MKTKTVSAKTEKNKEVIVEKKLIEFLEQDKELKKFFDWN